MFVVQQITRASSSHRPSFTFVGYVVEYSGGTGNKTERSNSAGNMSSRQHQAGSQTARGGQSARSRIVVTAEDLTLNITYEPPSPKFHQQRPDSSSYRLKLFQGDDFRYSVRGLPQQVKVHQNAYVIRWGPLELQFKSKQQLDMFASSIKHVKLEWAPCGQQTARQTAATLRSNRDPAPLGPLQTKAEAQPSQRRSFGSPLPVSDANEIQPSQPASSKSSDEAKKQATEIPAHSARKHDDIGTSSFWKDNWLWIGLGVAAAAAVTWTVLKAEVPTAEASQAIREREFKLHIVD